MKNDIKQLFENAGVSLLNENSLGEKIIPDDDSVKLQNFWNWFGDSKVVDEQGRPLVVYHGSPTMKVYNKKYLDNVNKLLQRMYEYKGISEKFKPITIDKIIGWEETIQEFIKQNPNFKVSKEELEGINQYIDFDSFDIKKRGLNTASDYNSGFFFTDNKEDAETFEYHISTNEFGSDEKIDTSNRAGTRAFYLSMKNSYIGKNISNKDIKKYQDMGYDGIINTMTNMKRLGRNIKKEYIVFEPNQIKSINNKGNFSMSSDNIYETVAYHGSPSKFDEFSLKYISSGEGHQVHGWGIYFTLDKEVARGYKYRLGKQKERQLEHWENKILEDIRDYGFDEVVKNIKYSLEKCKKINHTDGIKRYQTSLDFIDSLSIVDGMVLTVDIPNDDELLVEDDLLKN